MKSEVGKISKQNLEDVISIVRSKSGLNQWKSTPDVITWFKDIERKNTKRFIQLDVVNFYPSITEELLKNAIEWSRQFVNITSEDEKIIIETKNSILLNDGEPWSKKGVSNFDIAQGSYDGAECAELVGLFLLADLEKLDPRLNIGIYRDDCLAVTNASRKQTEDLKKKMCEIFAKHNLKTTATANLMKVDFLDVTLALDDGTFKAFNKPNNIPQYVHRHSNQPPSVIRNIPPSINKRLSTISSDEKMFQTAVPLFQEAIKKSGYDFTLKFDPSASNKPTTKKKNRTRKGHILWFNPPYNHTVTTNVGKEFLNLVDQCFPPGNPLRKIFNRNNVKISYSTTPNMAQIISGKNQKIMGKKNDVKTCSCPKNKKAHCPLDQKCISENIIYQATVSEPNKETKTYIGQTSCTFKARLAVHKQTFEDENKNGQTALSNYIHSRKNKGFDPTVTWKLIDRGKTFTPVTGECQLCIKEAFYILFKPELAKLNSRSEIFSACFHKKPALLVKPKGRGRPKKSPGT